MPAKTEFTTEQRIRAASLPNHGKTYTVIPHGYVIDETRKELQAAGFHIDKEIYKTNLDGQVAQGIYHLNYGSDSDMGLMFAWSNSYNKMMRFKCAVGAQVFICMNGVVSGDLSNYSRKHTGNALQEATGTIRHQIANARTFYDQLVKDKELLKGITLNKSQQAAIVGQLLIEQDVLTLSQVGIVKRELETPSHTYNSPADSAWTLYNHVTLALKDSHPMSYLNDHQKLHNFFIDQYTVTKKFVQPELNFEEETEEELVESNDNGVIFL
jgi:hypothetical protein